MYNSGIGIRYWQSDINSDNESYVYW